MKSRIVLWSLVITTVIGCGLIPWAAPAVTPSKETWIGKGAGEFSLLFEAMTRQLTSSPYVRERVLGGRPRTIFVPWISDHVHVLKAMKFLAPEVSSFLDFFLEHQTAEGLYFDYFYPVDDPVNSRMNIFDRRYWKILPPEKLQLHRLPVEADLEYLMVEGVWYVWQATGDLEYLGKRVAGLERGLTYAMTDPLRWSRRYQLVKRGYTLDTWDFMQLPATREEYVRQGGDVQKGIFDIDASTPMGVMHGDNSGMYAACRLLAAMFLALGREDQARIWEHHAGGFRLRTNALCWNGRFYRHFLIDDPMPSYLKMDQDQTLSLSNPYDINRGLPTPEMAQSIIQVYRDLRDRTAGQSLAEWFGIYPAVEPHFADYEPGSYMNGGVNTIVAGELAKAAFQHGFEDYGVDILRRIHSLVEKHGGDLPVAYRPDGTVDSGIPDNWGQAAVFSAMVEGLAGIVDRGALFRNVELSPRWLAAGVDSVEVSVAYGPSGRKLRYSYSHVPEAREIRLEVAGDAGQLKIRILLPPGSDLARAERAGTSVKATIENVRSSRYAVVDAPGSTSLVIVYR